MIGIYFCPVIITHFIARSRCQLISRAKGVIFINLIVESKLPEVTDILSQICRMSPLFPQSIYIRHLYCLPCFLQMLQTILESSE